MMRPVGGVDMSRAALNGLWLSWILTAAAAALAVPSAHAGTLTTVYDFHNGTDGAQPVGGVIADAAGTLYGETNLGGGVACTSRSPQSSAGCGTVYSYNPAAGLKTLAAFTGPNGAHGINGLTLLGSTLYGSTAYGGASDDGVLFSIGTDGTGYKLLHQFTGTDGKIPAGFLRIGQGGVLYGVTQQGGPSYPKKNYGVLFSLKPDGTYAVLHVFTNGPDGSAPNTLLIASNGTLVGSATYAGSGISSQCRQGCGTVFEYAPTTAAFTVLHSFDGFDGAFPYVGSFGPGPTIYGAASNVFSISAAGYSIIANFGMYDGYDLASGPLYLPNGSLVGVTISGPAEGGGLGTIYTVQRGVLTSPYIFGGGDIAGISPEAQPIVTPARTLIGTTTVDGLCGNC